MNDNPPELEPLPEVIERRAKSFLALREQMGRFHGERPWVRSMAESYERMRSLMEYWKWMACPPRQHGKGAGKV